MSGLDFDPIEIKVSAAPKLQAAHKANKSGRKGRPLENSGPLAQKMPVSARTMPIDVTSESEAPCSNE